MSQTEIADEIAAMLAAHETEKVGRADRMAEAERKANAYFDEHCLEATNELFDALVNLAEQEADLPKHTQRQYIRSFLDTMFPVGVAKGFLNVWTDLDKTSRWFNIETEREQAVAYLIETNRRGNVWYQTGLTAKPMGSNKRGTEADVVFLPGFHSDLDWCDPKAHKKSKDLPPDIEACRKIANSLYMPPSLVVNSGHGLQAYWVCPMTLVIDEDRRRAKDISERLQRQVELAGRDNNWAVDSTPDLVRLLRVPGTLNRKYEPFAKVLKLSGGMCDPVPPYTYTADQVLRSVEALEFLRRLEEDAREVEDGEIDFKAPVGPPAVQSSDVTAKAVSPPAPVVVTETRFTDDEIIQLMVRAKNAAKIKALWQNGPHGKPSGSEADEALACIIAFYTRDPGQIERIMRRAPLCSPNREKWSGKRPDYPARTIQRALELVREQYKPPLDPASVIKSFEEPETVNESALERLDTPVPVDVSWLPKRLRRIIKAMTKSNRFLKEEANLFASMFIPAVILGKRYVSRNGRYRFYANLWVSLMLASGQGKSSIKLLIEQELARLGYFGIGAFTFASIFMKGSTLPAKEMRLHQQNKTLANWFEEQNVRAETNLDGEFIVQEEATDRLKRALGAWDSKNPAADTGNMIDLIDSGTNITNMTKGNGLEYLADNCWSFIGTAQTKEWSEVMDHTYFIERGLTTRFIVAGFGVSVTGFEDDDDFETADQADEFLRETFRDMRDDAMDITTQIEADLGITDDHDPIRVLLDEYPQTEVFKALDRYHPELAQYGQNKFLPHAFRIAQICAFVNRDHVVSTSPDGWGDSAHKQIDISKYVRPAYDMVMRQTLAYAKDRKMKTEFADIEEKLLALYKRKRQPLSVRDILANVKAFKRVYDLKPVLEVITGSGGTWEAVKVRGTRGPETVKYKPID